MTVRGDSWGLLWACSTDKVVVGGSRDGGSGMVRLMGVVGGLWVLVSLDVLSRDSIWVVSIDT